MNHRMLILGVGILCAFFAQSCKTTPPKHHHLTILVDLTDSNDMDIDPDEIWNYILKTTGISSMRSGQIFHDKVTVSVTPINEFYNNASKSLKLKAIGEYNVVAIKRKKEVDQFLQDIKKILLEVTTKTGELNSSMIYPPICNTLSEVGKMNADNKHVLIFSDLGHNSEQENANFYRQKIDALAKSIKGDCELGTLNDVSIQFIYEPNHIQGDQMFEKAKKVWTLVLDSTGADIEFGSQPK